MQIDNLTIEEFEKLPHIITGESKIVRDAGNGLCVIKFKPTIYSFTANRCGIVEGSDVLRLQASKIFTDVLRKNGIKHAYQEINDRFVLAERIMNPPPIEVVVKAFHSGTSKHRYLGFDKIRESHPYYPNYEIKSDGAYPQAIVRFDWRNPLYHPSTGKTVADEVLCEDQAEWFIDTKEAKKTAWSVYHVLSDFLAEKDIILYDLCLFISEDGKTVFGEISQDCGRFRHFDLGSLDKDEWRAGGSSEKVMQKWRLLLDLIS